MTWQKSLEIHVTLWDRATAKIESNENSGIEFEVKAYFTAVENDDEDSHQGSVTFDMGDDDNDDDAILSPPAQNRQSIGVNTHLGGIFSPIPP